MKNQDQLMGFEEFASLPVLDTLLVSSDDQTFKRLDEGKWVPGRFASNIRIDQPTHGVGQTHAHVYGRKGNELGVVNFDGTASHGTKVRLSSEDAGALRAQGFKIKPGNIVEWIKLDSPPELLFG